WIANTAPKGPTYVVLDAGMQEAKLPELLSVPDPTRLAPPVRGGTTPELIEKAAQILRGAKHPLMMPGRVSRNLDCWNARIALAEKIACKVITDIKVGAAFPTDHPLHAGAPAFLTPAGEAADALAQADVILSFDWVDLAGALRASGARADAKVIQISADHHLHNGWSMDYQGLAPIDLFIPADPDDVLIPLARALGAGAPAKRSAAA